MRVLIAPDKFKGTLDAAGVAAEIARGIRDVVTDAEIDIAPVADGGEGMAAILQQALGGGWVKCAAHDPLGRAIEASYVRLDDDATAVIETSEAAGLRRLQHGEREVLHASTFGVGEMLLDAARHGAQTIIVGLGGSATNDGGFGLARALGFEFVLEDRRRAERVEDLTQLERIVAAATSVLPQIIGATDVDNPLLGERGATRVFGEQKGASGEQRDVLERALTRLADVAARDLRRDFRDLASAGAAGGLGFGLATFCGAQLRSGFDVVADALELREQIETADVVITGEGRLDAQTLAGKAPAGVARLARAAGKRVFAIVGEVAADSSRAAEMFDAVLSLVRPPLSRTAAIKLCKELLRERAAELATSFLRR